MQERDGNPDVPGQWIEQGSEVDFPGLKIFLQTFPGKERVRASNERLESPGAIMMLCWSGVMEMEEGSASPGTATYERGAGPVVGRPGRLIVSPGKIFQHYSEKIFLASSDHTK